MSYAQLFLITFLLALLAVPAVKRLAFKFGILDIPDSARKIHGKPIPFMGGLAIALSFFAGFIFYIQVFQPNLQIIPPRFFWGIGIGSAILIFGGFLDEKYNLPARKQIIFPLLAALTVVLSGIGVGITTLSNPFGAPLGLAFSIFGIQASAIFIFLFILGMIYTTKFLDGMDGLASGISLIASLTLFFLSLTPRINQDITASIAILLAGAIAGFLVFNFNPASIFLGESGSTFLGFMLGVLSVLLGGKIATAILVMGIPIMDVAWVITRRLWYGVSPFQADRKHLHFRLMDIGFSQRQTVLILYSIAIIFGGVAIFLQSLGKLIALIILLCVMLAIALSTVMLYKRKNGPKN